MSLQASNNLQPKPSHAPLAILRGFTVVQFPISNQHFFNSPFEILFRDITSRFGIKLVCSLK